MFGDRGEMCEDFVEASAEKDQRRRVKQQVNHNVRVTKGKEMLEDHSALVGQVLIQLLP